MKLSSLSNIYNLISSTDIQRFSELMGCNCLLCLLRFRAATPGIAVHHDLYASAPAECNLFLQGRESRKRHYSADQELPLRGPQLSGGGQHT